MGWTWTWTAASITMVSLSFYEFYTWPLTQSTGIPQDRMVKEFKGELVYNQEVRSFPPTYMARY